MARRMRARGARALLEKLREKVREIVGVVMNVIGCQSLGRNMHGAHSQGVRHGKIARIVLEHRGALGGKPGLGENFCESGFMGLWLIARILDTVDRIEQARQATRAQHVLRVGGGSVGVDDLAPGKSGDALGEVMIGCQRREGNIVHLGEVGFRVDVVMMHQTGERGAVFGPVAAAQPVRLNPRDTECLHDEIGHLHFDLVEEAHMRRVKRIVEVEDPGIDMREVFARHGVTLGAIANWRKTCTMARSNKSRAGAKAEMKEQRTPQKDAYSLILEAIDMGDYKPGDRLVENELAERFGVSRTPIREALQRLETQSLLARDGRSLIVASLDHNQMAELYAVRAELEGLAAQLAARHATDEEMRVLRDMVEEDRALVNDPGALAQANRRFHRQIHLASHNRFLVQQLNLLHQSMALMATTSLAAEGRSTKALEEHDAIVRAIENRDEITARDKLKSHISKAFVTRLKLDSGA